MRQPSWRAATAAMGQHGCCACFQQWQSRRLLLSCIILLLFFEEVLMADISQALVPCPGKPHCVALVVDGTIASVPPIFRQAVTNASVNEIVLAGSRYVLRPSSWTVFTQQQPYRLQRNLTIRGPTTGWAVMDFSLIEKKVLIAPDVTVTFKNLVLLNVRKLGGFGLDFFMGETGSRMMLLDTIRVKPACQLPGDVLRSAQSFQRVSPRYPPNTVELLPRLCFTAALSGPEPQLNCFQDVLQFEHFSMLAAYNDPDKGSQYPGYVLYQENTTRVCQSTITQQCLDESNGDEELCMAMLVAATGLISQPRKVADGWRNGALSWSPGIVAGIAVSGGILVLLLFLLCVLRRKLFRCWRAGGKHQKQIDDPEAGLRATDADDAILTGQGHIPSYTLGSKAISQQVTLNTLLGAGSFGRVYKGRWHSTDVAIKIITVRSPEELPRVLREAEVMLQLDHANIVRAFHASVWNPSEQVKAACDVRTSTSSSAAREAPSAAAAGTSRGGARATPPASGAAAADAGARTRRNAPQRNNSSLLRGPAGTGNAPAAAQATTSGQHLTTPSVSSERPPNNQQDTSSTFMNSSSGNHAGKSGQAAVVGTGAAAAAAAAAAVDGTAGGRGVAGVTGWLQFMPQQLQQPNRAVLNRLSSASADCASTMLDDVNGLRAPAQAGAAGAAQPAGQQGSSAVRPAYVRSSSDGALDVPGPHGSTQPKQAQQPAGVHQPPTSNLQQQQQDHEGGLRRNLLLGWRHRQHKGTTSTPHGGDSGSSHAAAAGAGEGPSTSSHDGHDSGASAAAAAVSSGGGAVAIMHASEVQGSACCSSKQSCPGSWNHTGSHSSHTRDGQDGHQEAQIERQVWIILELCTGGTLLDAALGGKFRLDAADSSESRMEMAKLLSRLLDAANGMAYLHARGVMHGDLKAGNVLLQHSIHGSYGQIAKISDFGLSTMLLSGATHRSTASLGTLTHMSPELLRNGRMSPSADVYSFGILMWEVFCGKQAWQGLHYGVVVERVVIQKERPPIPAGMPKPFRVLMERCWSADPANRPTFTQIVRCLELMLDSLGSDNEGSESSFDEDMTSAIASSSIAPAALSDQRQQQEQEQQEQPYLAQHLQPVGRMPAPPAGPLPLAPAPVVAAMSGPAALPAARIAGGLGLASPSTPTAAALQPSKQFSAYDVLTPSGGTLGQVEGGHASQQHSSSSQHLRSSSSQHPHSNQLGLSAAAGSTVRLASVLDENVYLQDL